MLLHAAQLSWNLINAKEVSHIYKNLNWWRHGDENLTPKSKVLSAFPPTRTVANISKKEIDMCVHDAAEIKTDKHHLSAGNVHIGLINNFSNNGKDVEISLGQNIGQESPI